MINHLLPLGGDVVVAAVQAGGLGRKKYFLKNLFFEGNLLFFVRTWEQSKLNHQSQMKYSWLKMVPLGQRKDWVPRPPRPSGMHTWKAWHWADGSA